MHNSATFIAEVNENNRQLLYRCRWSEDDRARIVPGLIEVLSDEDRLLVDDALRGLFVIGPAAVVAAPHVIPLISSSFPITRQMAILTLGQIAHHEPMICLEPMIKALEHSDCRDNAMRTLAFLNGHAKEAIPAIVQLFESKDAKTRVLVVRTVAAIDGRCEMALCLFHRAQADRSKLVSAAAEKVLKQQSS